MATGGFPQHHASAAVHAAAQQAHAAHAMAALQNAAAVGGAAAAAGLHGHPGLANALAASHSPVSYTHLTLPTTPYV